MIKLNKGLCQIILYCKGYFKVSNTIEDLKILIGYHCGIDPIDVSFESIYWHLLEIIREYGSIKPYLYYNILAEMFKWKEVITKEDMFKEFISKIKLLPIKDKETIIIELGEPDYNILPSNNFF